METINNATAAVKNTIWGEGTTTGNHTETHRSMVDDSVTETKFNGRLESDPDAEGSYQPGKGDTDRKPAGPTATGGQPQGANITNNQGTNENSFSSSNEPNTGFGGSGAQPSVTADPSSGQGPNSKYQGAGRPMNEPEAESTMSGDSNSSIPPPSGSSDSSPVGGMKLPDSENKSKGEGTGTLYEKSTGLHCDGGDFDATRPGAAREAARLMDETGIERGQGEQPEQKEKKWYGVDHSGFGGHGSHQNKRGSVSSTKSNKEPESSYNEQSEYSETSGADGQTEKKGLGQKIKEKLHH